MTDGRSCPLAYRYAPETLGRDPVPVEADVVYVVGGLYGNLDALDAIEAMAEREVAAGRRVQLIFNGDFNWFNASDDLFEAVNRRVLAHTAQLGNVEYELANPSPGAGCGCAYPDFVDQGVVDRSNRIMERLKTVAARHPTLTRALADLPRFRCLFFGGLKILVLHGDPESLAGWGLAHEAFAAGNRTELDRWFQATGVDGIVCTHTCLPVLWQGQVHDQGQPRPRWVSNNGSAGMGILKDDPRGLVVRLSPLPPLDEAVVAMTCEAPGGPLHLGLVPVAFDSGRWLSRFDRLWPAGSAAAVSYRARLACGTRLSPNDVRFPAT